MPLTAFGLNCTLKMPEDHERSSINQMLNVECETTRALAHEIKPGVLSDMGEGDDWPKLLLRVGIAIDAHVIAKFAAQHLVDRHA
ncbi:hypothetical protein LB553_16175 [Mesorhizobium sp. CA8]|uniref:hypothetical protein n=1 Tax=Mesorhizobium sp. CA8 TaxID=2876637 RepID=UPI001CC94695|nr:hypothetical protein [Mesorhizobium sp. CA8]MBZ9762403.1 hypothetical protein [Mesorhizobium sp. CA8]